MPLTFDFARSAQMTSGMRGTTMPVTLLLLLLAFAVLWPRIALGLEYFPFQWRWVGWLLRIICTVDSGAELATMLAWLGHRLCVADGEPLREALDEGYDPGRAADIAAGQAGAR